MGRRADKRYCFLAAELVLCSREEVAGETLGRAQLCRSTGA